MPPYEVTITTNYGTIKCQVQNISEFEMVLKRFEKDYTQVTMKNVSQKVKTKGKNKI